jgi:hypothetical protein
MLSNCYAFDTYQPQNGLGGLMRLSFKSIVNSGNLTKTNRGNLEFTYT